MLNKLKIEFLGTFFLILTIALTGNPLAIGGVLVALVYMGGYISGAHYNPAVTLSMMVTNKIKSAEAVKYIATQMTAGIFAALVYNLIAEKKFIPSIASDTNFVSAFFVELIFTFLLCSVILHVAATDKTKGNDYFGVAIGFTLMIAAFAGGPISGGAFNPAVGISPLLYDITNIGSHLMHIGLYLAGPISGGIIAGIMYKSLHTK